MQSLNNNKKKHLKCNKKDVSISQKYFDIKSSYCPAQKGFFLAKILKCMAVLLCSE